jgi:hypothetical protein
VAQGEDFWVEWDNAPEVADFFDKIVASYPMAKLLLNKGSMGNAPNGPSLAVLAKDVALSPDGKGAQLVTLPAATVLTLPPGADYYVVMVTDAFTYGSSHTSPFTIHAPVKCTVDGGHAGCTADEYCDKTGACSACGWCAASLDSFDGWCPAKCGAPLAVGSQLPTNTVESEVSVGDHDCPPVHPSTSLCSLAWTGAPACAAERSRSRRRR